MNDIPNYLTPYHDAARRHAGGFGSLLWASTLTQAARFETICRLVNLTGRSILDIGCGRADLLNYLQTRNIAPADYIGIEAVPPLLAAASDTIKNHRNARIIDADFLAKPASMFVGAEVVIISGALNTLDTDGFYTTIRRAFDAAGEMLVFNFLDSSLLAAASYLTWHSRSDVLKFASSLSRDVQVLSDYLDGDSTIAVGKDEVH